MRIAIHEAPSETFHLKFDRNLKARVYVALSRARLSSQFTYRFAMYLAFFNIVYVVSNYDRCSVDSNDLSIGNEHTFSAIVVAEFDRVVNQVACKVCKLLLAYSSRATCSTLISPLETRAVYVTRYAPTA